MSFLFGLVLVFTLASFIGSANGKAVLSGISVVIAMLILLGIIGSMVH